MSKETFWILGAPTPQIMEIEAILRGRRILVGYAIDELGNRTSKGTLVRGQAKLIHEWELDHATVHCVDCAVQGWTCQRVSAVELLKAIRGGSWNSIAPRSNP